MSAFLRAVLKVTTLLFLAGNTLLLILIILSGAVNNYPVNHFYWVQGDTRGIPNASDLTRWTFWGACERRGQETFCGNNLSPAYPISPVDNFGTTTNVPDSFISNRDSFYYLTRFSFCFFWIALAFIGISFLLYIGSWCSYGFAKVVWMLTAVGCLFNVTAVVLQTAASVMARNAFSDSNREASLGADLYGIAWASVSLSIMETAFTVSEYFTWFLSKSREQHTQVPVVSQETGPFKSIFSSKKEQYPTDDPTVAVNDQYASNTVNTMTSVPPHENTHSGINFFTIRKSQKTKADEESV